MRKPINSLCQTIIFVFISTFIVSVPTFGQNNVGIGTASPNANAALDIVATDKGVLIPRVALTSTNASSPLSSFVAGMMVYNTATTGDVTPGFYFCNGTKWEKAGGAGWTLTGNAGTSSGANFIGTSDNQDVVLKRNNVRAGYIGLTNTSWGRSALNAGTGDRNTAFGSEALLNISTGIVNTAIGSNALRANTIGFNNVAIGVDAVKNITEGDNNVGCGTGSLFTNVLGNSNTALGVDAGFTNTGSGNVFLGYAAGRNETGSNKLYIHNNIADANNALIYGEFDGNKKLRINGKSESIYNITFLDDPAVYGENDNTDFYGVGVQGKGGWKGVEGIVAGTGSTTNKYYGVYGQSTGSNTATNYGVYGLASNGTKNFAGYFEGAVSIGGSTHKLATGHLLSVDGKIACTEVRVQPSSAWPDYVFSPSYDLMPLNELEKTIQNQKHLPGIPSAKEVEIEGIQLGEMQRKMIEKIEELTLYVIDLNKKVESLQTENEEQAVLIDKLKK